MKTFGGIFEELGSVLGIVIVGIVAGTIGGIVGMPLFWGFLFWPDEIRIPVGLAITFAVFHFALRWFADRRMIQLRAMPIIVSIIIFAAIVASLIWNNLAWRIGDSIEIQAAMGVVLFWAELPIVFALSLFWESHRKR